VDWIGAILESIRAMECPNCGARLQSCSVRGITAEPDALVVRLACSVCGENSLAVVKRENATPRPAPISRDDVLDAHDFLKQWHGTVDQAIAPRAA
jgi:predicted RNA-binding Zn-ribbon protein involved in translation (DUF1610 family)